ncbi:MAG TPA: ribonuclease P protein component [Firmicutes bacterium]|jgi:ribonuclease P protein component|nr:ribonuclease P protein component [Bacillota bacterium]
MRKEERLTKRADFSAVYQNGKSLADRYLVLYYFPRPIEGVKVGISVSRKVAGSVGRNRLKRLVREAWRAQSHRVISGYHLIVIVRVAGRNATYAQIVRSLEKLTKKAGLFCNESIIS